MTHQDLFFDESQSSFPIFFPNLEHKEVQLRVQLQIEKIMMTSLMDSFQETSVSERQAIVSAQEMAAFLQHEMSQATTACDAWKNEVKSLTKKRWQSSAQRAKQEESRCITHLFFITTENYYSQLSMPTERVHSPTQTSRPAEGQPPEKCS